MQSIITTQYLVGLLTGQYQAPLVSGTNIKTVNGNSLLGSGNVSITASVAWGGITGDIASQGDLYSAIDAKQDTLVSGTNIKTINSTSLLGSGNITITGGTWGSIGGTLPDQADLNTALNARVLKAGDTLTGPLLAADGSSTACSYAFTSQTNSGLFRNSSGVQICHNGTAILDCRSSGAFVAGPFQPSTDNTRLNGAFNLRWVRTHSTSYRATLGSTNGYVFDDGAGNAVSSGMYAVSTTNLTFPLNGTTRLDITSTRSTFSNAVVAQTLSGSADPTTSDIASGFGAWWKNTTSGEIRWWVNDGGTMKKTAALT